MAELALLVQHYGGRNETAYGISGLGDLMLTCTGTLSKNLQFGILLGQGLSLEQATTHFFVQPEGVSTLQSLHTLMTTSKLSLPLCAATYQCVFEGRPFKQALVDLWA
jgi:glycerol-3-phosphate dehydrogenase (NAD(P)+)